MHTGQNICITQVLLKWLRNSTMSHVIQFIKLKTVPILAMISDDFIFHVLKFFRNFQRFLLPFYKYLITNGKINYIFSSFISFSYNIPCEHIQISHFVHIIDFSALKRFFIIYFLHYNTTLIQFKMLCLNIFLNNHFIQY